MPHSLHASKFTFTMQLTVGNVESVVDEAVDFGRHNEGTVPDLRTLIVVDPAKISKPMFI